MFFFLPGSGAGVCWLIPYFSQSSSGSDILKTFLKESDLYFTERKTNLGILGFLWWTEVLFLEHFPQSISTFKSHVPSQALFLPHLLGGRQLTMCFCSCFLPQSLAKKELKAILLMGETNRTICEKRRSSFLLQKHNFGEIAPKNWRNS